MAKDIYKHFERKILNEKSGNEVNNEEFEIKNKEIYENFKDVKILDFKELLDRKFLTEILKELWAFTKGSGEVKNDTLSKALSVWKTFVETPNNTECKHKPKERNNLGMFFK